ncbi:MAG: DMSO reductase [Desulfobacteraceae bacterium 4572_130]|nr:MAG: DMSO reductase [Desulfobacteraceae bacterium 4572_130]
MGNKQNIIKSVKNIFSPSDSSFKPYDWMIKSTPQQEWIKEKGIFLWLAFFFSEIGAGLYFMSMFFQYRLGLILGWLITLVLGGSVHMLYLGNPKRFWRILTNISSSELARGMWVILVFAILGFFQIFTAKFNPFLNCMLGIICILIIMHGFATMNVIKALPSWNSTMVLPLSIISGIWVGSQIFQFMLSVSGSLASGFEIWSELFLLVYIGLIVFYLWGTFHSSEAAKKSINILLKGELAKGFYIGVIVLGIVVPLFFTLIMWGGNVNAGLIFFRMVFVFAGDLALRYLVMKSAVYQPLI